MALYSDTKQLIFSSSLPCVMFEFAKIVFILRGNYILSYIYKDNIETWHYSEP